MGNQQSFAKKANFEDVQKIINNEIGGILINTMNPNEQSCLITNTTSIIEEELIMNNYIKTDKKINIIIYDKNSDEMRILKKYRQLVDLGFSNVYIYTGGLFEWLLLQDIYGSTEFPTTTKELDILKFKGTSKVGQLMLE